MSCWTVPAVKFRFLSFSTPRIVLVQKFDFGWPVPCHSWDTIRHVLLLTLFQSIAVCHSEHTAFGFYSRLLELFLI